MNTSKFALITGSSSGIGRAMAEEFARRKINVLLIALPDTGLETLVNQLKLQYGIQAYGLELDLTYPDAPANVLVWCKEKGYHVNILVNNAGFGNLCSLEKTNPALLTNMMVLNNQAMVLLTQLFIPEIKKHTSGYIMNVGSLASFMPIPNKSVYAATKSFVYTFSSVLRLELLPYRIHVSCLCPGGTMTNKEVVARIKATGFSLAQMPAEVAHEAITKMFGKKYRIIPGRVNKILYNVRQILPEFAVCWILGRLFNRTKPEKAIRLQFRGSSLALAYR